MNSKLNRILLNRRNAICIQKTIEDEAAIDYKRSLIVTASVNLSSLGYCFSEELMEAMTHMSIDDIVQMKSWLLESIRENLGGDVDYKPLYPGFPESVIERSNEELYIDALNYYISGFSKLPENEYDYVNLRKKEHSKLHDIDFRKLKVIRLANEKELSEIARNIMSSQVAFSPTDKEDVLVILENTSSAEAMIPDKIPNKENLTYLAAEYIKKGQLNTNPFLKKIKTPTDLLRLIAVRNGYDSTLAQPIKYKTLPKAELRMYAKMLCKMKFAEPEIYARISDFKKLSESYHFRNILKGKPEDAKMQQLLDRMYEKNLERSFLSKRDNAIKKEQFEEAVNLYKKNPGQMGSDIIHLISLAERQKDVAKSTESLINAFEENAKKMATSNLLKIRELIKNRQNDRDLHIYMPKKGLTDPYIVAEHKKGINSDIANKIIEKIDSALIEKYKQKRPLGKTYINPELSDIKLPTMQRDSAKNSVGISYGSKFSTRDDCKVLRGFIWWTNGDSKTKVDIDLSASILDKELHKIRDISFYNLKEDYATHSGDIRDGGPKDGSGVAEFIDIDLNKLKDSLGEDIYIEFSVRIYSGESFVETPCKFGWMEGDRKFDKLFDVTKVEKAFELNANSKRNITAIYDVKENKLIWMDRSPRNKEVIRFKENTNISYMETDKIEAYRALHNDIPNLYDLAKLHVKARGEIIEDPKEADTIFSVSRLDPAEYPKAKESICSYDADIILGDLISAELSEKDKEFFALQREAELEKVKDLSEEKEREVNPMSFVGELSRGLVNSANEMEER